jgi:hypothetical protein
MPKSVGFLSFVFPPVTVHPALLFPSALSQLRNRLVCFDQIAFLSRKEAILQDVERALVCCDRYFCSPTVKFYGCGR